MEKTKAIDLINAGVTLERLEAALLSTAIGVANTEKKGVVKVEFTISPQKGTNAQVNIDAKVTFKKPTTKGFLSEEVTDSTPMFVSSHGLSALPDNGKLNFDKDSRVVDLARKAK